MFSGEFVEFLRSLPVDSPAFLEALVSGKIVAIAGITIVMIISLITIGQSIYRLIKKN